MRYATSSTRRRAANMNLLLSIAESGTNESPFHLAYSTMILLRLRRQYPMSSSISTIGNEGSFRCCRATSNVVLVKIIVNKLDCRLLVKYSLAPMFLLSFKGTSVQHLAIEDKGRGSIFLFDRVLVHKSVFELKIHHQDSDAEGLQ